jgi:hypothetical protein
MVLAELIQRHMLDWYFWRFLLYGYPIVGLAVWYHTRWWGFSWWQRLLYGFAGSWFAAAFNILYQGMLNPSNPKENPRRYFTRQLQRRR